MATLLSPRLMLRGFEIFVLVSLAGYGAVLLYGNNLPYFVAALGRVHWGWVLVGLVLASMDWIGGGLRLWVITRELHPRPSLLGMTLAGGMGAWAAYLTPANSGAGPMTIYTMRRYGVPLPVAMTATLISFVATVVFFALAGPLAIVFGAGKSLGDYGNLVGLSLYDLFLISLGIFGGLGVLMVLVMFFPRLVRDALHRVAAAVGRRSERVAARLARLQEGIDQAHEAVERFNTPRGWLALGWATLLSGPSHANKLLAGYVALRAVGIEANFVDVLLVQTLITFLLYFAPTPGASGIAELLSALVMSSAYVRPELTPLYTLIWRCILSYFTIGFGFLVFHGWVRHGVKGLETETGRPVGGEEPAVLGDRAAGTP
ncbi:MAG TPA: lysylphosphatidylglycerol synthase transmembrane domain-containing protein [Gemmatimonadales bacterium]|nr:lysylphosphatidylglycerol synthase transmembrane domain-containing protein [Gemmatimonadales bacterium]